MIYKDSLSFSIIGIWLIHINSIPCVTENPGLGAFLFEQFHKVAST
jgi:hypothetical protein